MHSHALPRLGFSVMGSPNSVHEYLLCTPISAAVNKTFAGTECPADGSAKAKTQTTSSIPEECSMASIENSHGEGSQKVDVPDSLDAFVLRRTLVYSKALFRRSREGRE